MSGQNLPAKPLPTEYDALASHPSLINRAIAMHLLREGQFSVAQTFISEALDNPPLPTPTPGTPNPYSSTSTELEDLKPDELQAKFSEMYEILNELKNHNLAPAIVWSRINSAELDRRGSNLEFELSKLQYLWLFEGPKRNGLPDNHHNGVTGAIAYAKLHFPHFPIRHRKEIQKLVTAILYQSNLNESPYKQVFDFEAAWEEVSSSFTREFCFLLGLSAESPLYVAATAGAIALPTLLKLASIVKEKRTEWTTQNELPVEIPLPRSMIYHAIFVCPVSKEQTTEENPPMMMPCGHVVAKESLHKLAKGGRFKCPYCPNESHTRDAKQITL